DQQMPRLNPVSILAVDRDNPAWTDNFSAAAMDAIDSVMPAVEIPEADMYDRNGDKWGWKVFSPRIGLTWDATGDGKTIAKLSFATYGDFMGTSSYGQMPGGASGRLYFWYLDNNSNGTIDVTELYWYDRYHGDYTIFPVFDGGGNLMPGAVDKGYYYGYRYFDPDNPSALTDPLYTMDTTYGSGRTMEIMFTLEREIFTDFAVQLNATYRKYDKFTWTLDYYIDTDEIENQDMYESAGLPPANVPGMGSTKDAASHEWYNLKSEYGAASNYWLEAIPERYRDYIGIDLVFNKRLSNKWMLNGNFTWQTQATHYGDKGYMNETNLWAYEGKPYAAYIGGASGKINQYVFPRWMFKLSGLYQLPLDINVSGVFMVREGWVIREYFNLTDYTLPNPNDNSGDLDLTEFGSDRLPVFYRFDVRLEKMIRLGDTGRIYLMADLFNIFNSAIINRRYQKYHGAYEVFADPSLNSFAADPDDFDVNEILNPRLLRLGVRFQF
ncbi:MAG: hypothetical protein JXB26_10875, partial [Candidatus Aminicenantes bacterium]|nr:hypothetical protein [Candidatus Aminicenantes bacterium]